jgi:hypothetical protein
MGKVGRRSGKGWESWVDSQYCSVKDSGSPPKRGRLTKPNSIGLNLEFLFKQKYDWDTKFLILQLRRNILGLELEYKL